MDTKKVLALAIIVLAVFSCMTAVSAGLFDFIGGGDQVKNATYKFDGFTLTFPEGATFKNNTTEFASITFDQRAFAFQPNAKDTVCMVALKANGSGTVNSVDEYKNAWLKQGAIDGGKFGEWTIIDLHNTTGEKATNSSFFALVKERPDGSFVVLEGEKLDDIKKVAGTYKESK